MNRRHSIALAAASSCVATLLVGGIARATIPGDGGVINGCYGKIAGVVRVIDVAKGEKCVPSLETPLSWNQKGQKGEPGLPGAAGAPGTNGADGDDGVSPTVAQLAQGDANCPAGGAAITDAHGSTAFVCSGQPFSGTFTSPSGEYSMSVTDAGISLARGGTPVVQISGSSIEITGHEVAVTSELDATVVAGRNLLVSSGHDMVLSTGGDASVSVGRNASISTAGDASVSVGRNALISTAGDAGVSVGQNASISTGADASVVVGRALAVQSGSAIAFESGTSTSVLSGTQIAIQSGSTTSVQSSATLALNGSQVQVNGGVTCLRAARVSDAVTSTQIASGSSTVCIG
jgi:hypothetical protein